MLYKQIKHNNKLLNIKTHKLTKSVFSVVSDSYVCLKVNYVTKTTQYIR